MEQVDYYLGGVMRTITYYLANEPITREEAWRLSKTSHAKDLSRCSLYSESWNAENRSWVFKAQPHPESPTEDF